MNTRELTDEHLEVITRYATGLFQYGMDGAEVYANIESYCYDNYRISITQEQATRVYDVALFASFNPSSPHLDTIISLVSGEQS